MKFTKEIYKIVCIIAITIIGCCLSQKTTVYAADNPTVDVVALYQAHANKNGTHDFVFAHDGYIYVYWTSESKNQYANANGYETIGFTFALTNNNNKRMHISTDYFSEGNSLFELVHHNGGSGYADETPSAAKEARVWSILSKNGIPLLDGTKPVYRIYMYRAKATDFVNAFKIYTDTDLYPLRDNNGNVSFTVTDICGSHKYYSSGKPSSLTGGTLYTKKYYLSNGSGGGVIRECYISWNPEGFLNNANNQHKIPFAVDCVGGTVGGSLYQNDFFNSNSNQQLKDAGYGATISLMNSSISLNLPVYEITLDSNGGSGGTNLIYQAYEVGYYLDENCVYNINEERKIVLPTKAGYTFKGYYEPRSREKCIDENGNILVSPSYNFSVKTLIAEWIDDIKPTGTITICPTTWTNTPPTITVNSSDSGSGIASIVLYNADGTQLCATTSATLTQEITVEGTSSYYAIITDLEGNTYKTNSVTAYYDKTVPTLSASTVNGWYKENKELTFTCSDNASGIKSFTLYATNGTVLESTTTSSLTYTFTTEGSVTYKLVATDNANNTTTKTIYVAIDKNGPVLNILDEYGWFNTDTKITLSATDNVSGIYNIWLYAADGTELVNSSRSPIAYTFTENGTYTFKALDGAGNITEKSFQVKIDRVKPTLDVLSEYGWFNVNTELSFNGTDDLSGIQKIVLKNGNGTTIATSSVSVLKYIFSKELAAAYTITVSDNAGNIMEYTFDVKIDKTAPTFTSNDENGFVKPSTNILWCYDTVDEGGSGFKEFKIYDENMILLDTEKISFRGNDEFYLNVLDFHLEKVIVEAYDNAGNITTEIFGVDIAFGFDVEFDNCLEKLKDETVWLKGHTAIIKITTYGYADKIEFVFDDDFIYYCTNDTENPYDPEMTDAKGNAFIIQNPDQTNYFEFVIKIPPDTRSTDYFVTVRVHKGNETKVESYNFKVVNKDTVMYLQMPKIKRVSVFSKMWTVEE